MIESTPISVTSIIPASAPGEFLASTTAGLATSSDGGETWTLSSDPTALLTLSRLHDASHPELLCAGRADGVAISIDGGDHWHHTLASSPVTAIAAAVDSRGETVVLAGTERDGIYRSTDQGRTWSSALAGLRSLEILCIEPSAKFSEDNTIYAGTASGVHRSRNAGKAWRPGSTAVVQAIGVSPVDSVIWVGTESSGLLVSHDDGTSWTSCPDLGNSAIGAIVFTRYGVMVATDTAIRVQSPDRSEWLQVAEIEGILCLQIAAERTVLVGAIDLEVCRLTRRDTNWVLESCRMETKS